MADDSATFQIDLEGNASQKAVENARSLEDFRAAIKSAQDKIREHVATLGTLRGKSQDVLDTRAKLKAAIDKERVSITQASTTILEHGSSYGKLAAKAKEAAKGVEGAAKGVKGVGGPLESAREKLDALKEAFSGANKGALLLGGAVALLVAVIVAVSVAALAGAVALAKFAIQGADLARSMDLVREAATGSAANAHNLGTQVDAIAKKVPTAKGALNELAAELARTMNNTRASGAAIVDTFDVISQAGAAMGDSVGRQLGDIITRGKTMGRMQINPLELQGTGVKFDDVAGALAKSLHVGIGQARAALFEGRVKLDDGARAMRDAVDKRFGEINARKMLSLDVQVEKLHETFQSLTKDIKLEPLLAAVKDIFTLFDSSTVTGATIKALVELVGNGLVKAFVVVAPFAKEFLRGAVLGALDVAIGFGRVALTLKRAFGGDSMKSVFTLRNALMLGKMAVYAIGGAIAAMATVAAVFAAPFVIAAVAIAKVVEWGGKFVDVFKATDWAALGASIVDGLVGGLSGAGAKLLNAIKGLASGVKNAFVTSLGIHSPSKVFAQYGAHTAAGFAIGVQSGTPRAHTAIQAMAPAPMQATARATGRAGGSVTVNVAINVSGGGQDAARALSSPSFLDQLTTTLEHALEAAGVPMQSVPA